MLLPPVQKDPPTHTHMYARGLLHAHHAHAHRTHAQGHPRRDTHADTTVNRQLQKHVRTHHVRAGTAIVHLTSYVHRRICSSTV